MDLSLTTYNNSTLQAMIFEDQTFCYSDFARTHFGYRSIIRVSAV